MSADLESPSSYMTEKSQKPILLLRELMVLFMGTFIPYFQKLHLKARVGLTCTEENEANKFKNHPRGPSGLCQIKLNT